MDIDIVLKEKRAIDFRLDVIDIRTIFVLSDIYVAEKENSIIVTIGIM